MNDLSKKEETKIEESSASRKEASSSSELLQKKLENFLLLYFQAYLKGETAIEPVIRVAFLSIVKQDEDFAFKVRMMQLDYLKLENSELEGEWNEDKEDLFPKVAVVERYLDAHRKKTITVYKETILDLLKSSGELSS